MINHIRPLVYRYSLSPMGRLLLPLAVAGLMVLGLTASAGAAEVVNCNDADLKQTLACPDSNDDPVVEIILGVVRLILYATVVATIIMIMVAGVRYVLSAGNQQAVAAAKNTLKYAVIGFICALLAAAFITIMINALFNDSPPPSPDPDPDPVPGVPI